MTNSAEAAFPNALVLVSDPAGGEIPESMGGGLLASTRSCIAIGCRSDADGETTVTLGAIHDIDTGNDPVFEGMIDTPRRKVALRSVLGHTILEMPVTQQRTWIRVWVNDPKEPDRVVVGVG